MIKNVSTHAKCTMYFYQLFTVNMVHKLYATWWCQVTKVLDCGRRRPRFYPGVASNEAREAVASSLFWIMTRVSGVSHTPCTMCVRSDDRDRS